MSKITSFTICDKETRKRHSFIVVGEFNTAEDFKKNIPHAEEFDLRTIKFADIVSTNSPSVIHLEYLDEDLAEGV